MEYIFPVAEIEFHILGYLNPLIDFTQLSLVSKYYHDVVTNDKVYTTLKNFCLNKPIINFRTNNPNKEETIFIQACKYNHILLAQYMLHKYTTIDIHADNESAPLKNMKIHVFYILFIR